MTEMNSREPRDGLVLWYHESDRALVRTLDPHIRVLILYNPPHALHPFCVLSCKPEREWNSRLMEWQDRERDRDLDAYHTAVARLAHAALFLPCISPAFLLATELERAEDPALASALTTCDILPLLMRPTDMEGYQQHEPLCANDGYAREVACARLARTIEDHLRQSQGGPQERKRRWYERGLL